MTVRVRAAPAPSGELHVGNVRTFLFNWLFARHEGGVFVLRIEDTNPEKFTEEAFEAALTDMRWLGLDWDEGPEVGGEYGPYRQSERFQLHREAAGRLLVEGKAYRCYCTPAELEERRRRAMAEKRRPMYDERCYHLTDAERNRHENEGRPYAVRFRVPEQGEIVFSDLIVGEVRVGLDDVEDFVILRSDGSPLYQLGVAVDDALMKITHVIRGDDHRANTPKQILIHQALGNPHPVFAHVPQVLGPDGKPLAKRHGDTSVGEFRERGYLPEALFNYLAHLGWGTAEETLMTAKELIERFRLEDVHASPAGFDTDKLDWMNGEFIRSISPEDLAVRLRPFLHRAGLADNGLVEKIAPLLQTRIKQLDQAPRLARPIFQEVEMDPAAVEKALRDDYVPELFRRAIEALGGLNEFDRDSIERVLRVLVGEMGLKPRRALVAFHVAISGSTVAAPLFESMELVGREASLRRIERALEATGGG